jgi:hypothetical protein
MTFKRILQEQDTTRTDSRPSDEQLFEDYNTSPSVTHNTVQKDSTQWTVPFAPVPVIHRLTGRPVRCDKLRSLILQDSMSLGTVTLFFS